MDILALQKYVKVFYDLMYVGVLLWCWLQNMDIEELSNSVPVVVKVKLIVKIRHCEYP